MIESITNIFYMTLQSTPLAALAVAFAAGLLFTLSPCTLSMIPVIIGYVGGYSETSERSKLKGFTYSLAFVVGNSLVLAFLGATVSYVGDFASQSKLWHYFLIGILIVMGLHMLKIYTVKFPVILNYKPKTRGIFGAFLLGGVMGSATSPCSTPILTAVLAYVSMGGGAMYGGLLLLSYALGKGFILVLIGTFTGIIKYNEKIATWSKTLEKASGILLIIVALIFLWRL